MTPPPMTTRSRGSSLRSSTSRLVTTKPEARPSFRPGTGGMVVSEPEAITSRLPTLAHIGLAAGLDGEAIVRAALNLRGGADHRHLVGLHGGLHPGDQGMDHLALALHHLGVVEGDLLRRDAEGGALGGVAVELGGVQQGLGGNAALVEAGAAQVLPLEQGHLQAALGGPLGAEVAARAAADDK